jgi:hypothetical protein
MKRYILSLFCLSIAAFSIIAADNKLKSIALRDSIYTPDGAEKLPGFSPDVCQYTLPLSFNYSGGVPQISVEKNDAATAVTVVQARAIAGAAADRTATVTVNSAGLSDRVYTITFQLTTDYILGFTRDVKASYQSNMFSRSAGYTHGDYWGDYAVRPNGAANQYLETGLLVYGAKKLSFWMKKFPPADASDDGTARLAVLYRKDSSAWESIDTIPASALTDAWQKKEYTLDRPDGTSRIRLEIVRTAESPLSRDFIIDDLLVTASSGHPAAYTPAAPLPDPSAGAVPVEDAGDEWQSELVRIDADGKLTYRPDADGFILPDFSQAGYRNGNEAIPHVPVVREISPIEGDNTVYIQAAIDEIGRMSPDANGIRGALLLKKGLYPVRGPIKVPYDGVVLRGEGIGEDPAHSTVIYDWYRDADGYASQRTVIELGAAAGSWTSGKRDEENILDDVVPVGARTVRIAKNSAYQAGDVIQIFHPCTAEWLAAVKYGEVGPEGSGYTLQYAWEPGELPIYYHRYINKVEHTAAETKITLDAPVFYTLRKSLAQSTVFHFDNNTVQKSGVENLRVAVNATNIPDESHAWNCIHFVNAENCWAKHVCTAGFGKSGFYTNRATRITIEDCYALDPVARTTGERMYNFSVSSQSQLILFKDCYARRGRHNYVSNGTSTVSGIVIYGSKSEASRTRSEGHRRWSQGMLFDSYEDFNPQTNNGSTPLPVLGLFNRFEQGSGHGWAAVGSVLWNCNTRTDHSSAGARLYTPNKAKSRINLEKPPTSQNYAIGCFLEGGADDILPWTSGKTKGYVEGVNRPGLRPRSLYQAQLSERKSSAAHIEQPISGDDDATIYVDGKNIVIEQPGSISYRIYTVYGYPVASGLCSGRAMVPVASAGVWIVRAGNTVKKIYTG